MSHTRHRVLNRRVLFLLSVTLIFRIIMLATALGAIIYALNQHAMEPLYLAGGCLAFVLILQMIHSIESSKVVCPVCRSHILKNKRCSKHKNAKTTLGSHVLRVGLQVVFTKHFLCQYCNERYQWRGKRQPKTDLTQSVDPRLPRA
ncbi:hypothetical protein JIN77_05870 [Verrucomicrobiaceae bacterium R5-34]|uniref:Uncharacterized protein n=1 Tax=Oceaniferula flava TaxID=2800421 RepID=A0AAE2V831_9BACT|nr:hypothetical protein [Oceaniferula flavus]MBK1830241.1 hypothetical protein [Verrucomicrobiaceae bacterium R5-34]MBK1854832.1 hypothetical protein [Oceaniferula flavus]MBM1136138.1 hypothetical protein [Oceaniferula flavus]